MIIQHLCGEGQNDTERNAQVCHSHMEYKRICDPMCDWPWHFYLTWLHRSDGPGKKVQWFFIKLFFLRPFLVGLRNNTEKPYVLSAWFPTCPMLWTNRTVSLDDVDINAWKINHFHRRDPPFCPLIHKTISPFPLATWVTTGNHYVLLISLSPSFWEHSVDGITWYVIWGGACLFWGNHSDALMYQ